MAGSRKCKVDVHLEFISLEEIEFKKFRNGGKKKCYFSAKKLKFMKAYLKGPQNRESNAEGYI
jgi:hypothetical protein